MNHLKIIRQLLQYEKLAATSTLFEELGNYEQARLMVENIEKELSNLGTVHYHLLDLVSIFERGESKLEATKHLKAISGLDLRQSKDLVDIFYKIVYPMETEEVEKVYEIEEVISEALLQIIREGNKLEAIKQIKTLSGKGLLEVKEWVDKKSEELHKNITEDYFDDVKVADDGDLKQKVIQLLKGRRKIDAVKLVKETLGIGLAEAKHWVDAIENEL